MVNRVNTHFLPQWLEPRNLAGSTVVVIDILRASTTIISALAAGARTVHPCREVAEAVHIAAQLEPAVVLGGERDGLRIEGFQTIAVFFTLVVDINFSHFSFRLAR